MQRPSIGTNALGSNIGEPFHIARAASGLIRFVGFAGMAVAYNWPEGWVLSLFSLTIAGHAQIRRAVPERSVVISLLIDLMWVGTIFMVGNAPASAVVPGLTYLMAATVLALDGWRAGGFVIGIQGLVSLVALTLAAHVAIGKSTEEQVVFTLVAVAVHFPTISWLISSSTRLLRERQERAAREAAQEEKLRTVTDNASDSIVAFDETGRVEFANRTVTTMFGYEPADLVGWSIDRILPGFEVAAVDPHRTIRGVHREGHEIPLELTTSRSTKQTLRVAVMRDISERLGTIRRIEFQAALLDQVRTMVVAADLSGRLLYVNAYATDALGLTPAMIGTRRLVDLVIDSERPDLEDVPLPVGGTWRGEVTLQAADGSELPALVTLTGVLDSQGEPIGFGAVATDISSRKQTEAKMAAEIASKDQFVTSVSHELRTPLTVIVGMAEELRRSFDDFAEGDKRDLIGVIADQSSELANIVQDLLVIGRSDADGKLLIKPEPIDLLGELGTCVKLYLPPDRALEMSLVAGLPVLADPFQLRQVVRNLLTNAVRYGGLQLRLESVQDPEFTTVSLYDDGDGVPPDDIARIFDPYVRSATGPAVPGSMGLGLTVARMLSQLMGGDLVYERRDGWSVFQISLPTARVAVPV
ncbi:MAG: PAS domain-containing sensor histidine kinase [Acidimicrobiia bacterium]|nr:PAS domain-containing sensor histidine kinase [Acidimicrobiia bacterium]